MDWQPEALAALKKDVPFFVRPAVRRRVESMASEAGRSSIDLSFYAEAKAHGAQLRLRGCQVRSDSIPAG